jgi:hypothetical protein
MNESDLTMEKVVQFMLARCRSGAEKRLRYIIYNRRIWSASSGWVQKTYTGASPHTEHAHFSASYDSTLEASTASWHLEDIPVSIPAAQMQELKDFIAKEVRAVLDDRKGAYAQAALVDYRFDWSADNPKDPKSYRRDLADLTGDVWFAAMHGTTRGGDPLPQTGAFGKIFNELAALTAKVEALAEKG